MTPIPLKLRRELAADPYYKICCRSKDGSCDGRITWEHVLTFASKRLNLKWAIIPLCEYHHSVDIYQDGGALDKEINVWIALNRATDDELRTVSKAIDYVARRKYLNNKYGPYVEPKLPETSKINY